jgi:hypothetical protein
MTNDATLITEPQIAAAQYIKPLRTNHAHFELHLSQFSTLLRLIVKVQIQIEVLSLIQFIVTEGIQLAAFLLDNAREHILMQLSEIRFLRVKFFVARH